MVARQHPSFSQAQGFPSFSQASNCFVTFEFGTTDIPPLVIEVYPGGRISPPADPLRRGYVFDGWYSDSGFAAKWDFENHVGGDNFTLYAKWELIYYEIIYYLNGGINHPGNPATYTVEDPDIILKKPTRGEDEFIAWYSDLFFCYPINTIKTSEAKNVILFARFLTKRKIVGIAERVISDRYEGDPKLYLTPDGANVHYEAGQPVMERGLENQAYISLFTHEGWCGNVFLPPENKVGSDFEETCSGSITLSKLADIENSAIRALTSRAFVEVGARVQNPKSDNLRIEATVRSGGVLSLTREGALWRNQRERDLNSIKSQGGNDNAV